MTIAEKAQAIINLARVYEFNAAHHAKVTRANYAGVCAMHDSWEKDPNNHDGFDRNPYNPQSQEYILTQAEIKEKEAKEILEFTTDHFISMLKEG